MSKNKRKAIKRNNQSSPPPSSGEDDIEFKPQPKQELFLASPADIVIYGGAAGGGKTWSLLIEPLRHIGNGGFGAVIFRRTYPEITKEGAMWDESATIYPRFDGNSNKTSLSYVFPSGAKVAFSHLHDADALEAWRGAQIALIEFDQLETFTEQQFFYMLSRNRSMCGVRPYVRATCNPEPSWLADFLSWWIDDDGYAILNRSGVIRWMVRENGVTHWYDTRDKATEDYPHIMPKSVTFILSTVYDNQKLLKANPEYLSNLQSLSLVDRERLLGDKIRGGNWKIKPAAGKIFNRSWFEVVEPHNMPLIDYSHHASIRFYDFAATLKKMNASGKETNDPDYTASIKMVKIDNTYYIVDCTNEQIDPARTDAAVKRNAQSDGRFVPIRWEKEGGSSGERDSYHLVTMLDSYDAAGIRPAGDKILRAKPFAAQALAGNVKVLKARWTEELLNHLHGQPDLPHDDIMDACSGAYNYLADPSNAVEGESPIEGYRG